MPAQIDALSGDLRAAFSTFPPARREVQPLSGVRNLAQRFLRSFLPTGAYPESFDAWRAQGLVPRARAQQPWNTCASFAIAAAIQTGERIKHQPPVEVDPGFIHTCLVHQGQIADPSADGQAPADLLTALQAIKVQGCVPETGLYPFPVSQCSAVGGRIQISGFQPADGVARTRAAISTNGPVVSEMYFYENFFDVRGPGCVYLPVPDAVGPRGHVVCIVGYDSQGWIILNSFGPGWGDAGFAVIRYGDCGINSQPPAGLDDCRVYSIDV